VIVLAAFFRGVPMITVARMVTNVAIEVLVGTVPVLGNLFDIGWRANRRNYHLLEHSLAATRRNTTKDWVFMGLLGVGLMALAMLPVLLLLWIGGSVLHWMGAPGWR
jgi:membrane protein required for beta-lactamase induction